MNKHIVPYFGTRKKNEITPAEIIQWQNTIQEKGYSKTYERMIQNQLNALFNHAQKIYNLKENPCKKVKKMGKSDANKLEFWTKAEYDRFIAGIELGSEDYLIFEILFWTGIREGELLALSLSDFDMSGNLLHINKTYNRIKKRDVIDTPKTENSVRTIDIPNFLKEEVQEYAKKHYGFYFYPFFRTPQKFTREPSEFFHFADTFLSFSSSKVASAFAFSSVVMSR